MSTPAFAFFSSWVSRQSLPCSQKPPGCRLQNTSTSRMTLVSHEKLETLFDGGDTEMAKYKLELEVPGTLSKQLRRESIASLKARADFKGFRKGTIPPFVMKDVNGFVMRDAVSQMVADACRELGLKTIEGDAAEPEMDLAEMKSRWTIGEDFRFICIMPLEKTDDDGADPVLSNEDIDVEAVPTDDEIEQAAQQAIEAVADLDEEEVMADVPDLDQLINRD